MTQPNQIRRWPIWLVSAGLAGLAGWLFLRGQPNGLPVDDAYIHLVYAQNLAQGLGWCFNAGEPSLGTSSPLWVLLIRCLLSWFAPEAAVRILSLAGLIAASILIAELTLASLPSLAKDINSRLAGYALILLAAALFAFSGNLLWIAFCGMETIVFLAFGLLAVRGMASGRPAALTGISLALLVLTRIEGWVLYLVLFGWWLLSESRQGQARGLAPAENAVGSSRGPRDRPYPQILWLLIPILAWIAWTTYTWFHFGRILPSTMAGKLASNLFNSGFSLRGAGLFLWRHLVYLWKAEDFYLLIQLALCSSALAVLSLRPRRALRPQDQVQVPILGLVALWAVFTLFLHAFFFRSTLAITPYHYLRYQAPLFPALILGTMEALAGISAWLFHQTRPALLRNIMGVSLAAILALPVTFSFFSWRVLYARNLRHLQQSHRAAALWAKANLPEDARLAGFDIGSLKYFSGRYLIDLGGLTDPAIWPYLRERRVGPYLKEEKATHYLALDRPPEEGLTGVRKDDGTLYHLRELARFDAPDYPTPVRLHSLAVIVYALE
jgi:hypothetical protein